MENRVNREKEWHNATFGSDARKKTSKFYSVFIILEKELDKRIIENLCKDTTVFLDYGCGSGSKSIEFASMIKQGIGIDISEERINLAKLKTINNDNLDFLIMDAMNTSFENGYFDIIHGSAILHHLDLKECLEEIKRILKDGGTAFFVEPLDTNFLIKFYRKMTPEARTADEQPFRKKDIKLIKSIFPNTEVKHYFFLSLLAVPFRNYKIFGIMLSVLFFIDKILLNRYSPLKWLAWSCVIVLKK